MQVKKLAEVPAHGPRALAPGAALPALGPHDEQGRAWAVFPAQHGGRVELLPVEAARDGRVRFVAIGECRGVRVGELAHVRVGALANERLGIQLYGKRGRDGVVDPPGERRLVLIETRESVVRPEGRDRVSDGTMRLDV